MIGTFAHASDLQALVGQPLGQSDWILVDQERINAFAQATGDMQWIHVDASRAALGPYGGTVAHGFLTLSLVSTMVAQVFEVEDTRLLLNYGLDKVRFPAPVLAGSRLRGHLVLQTCHAVDHAIQLGIEVTIEREGAAKPVCVAQIVLRCIGLS